jgi:hypothetical protein
MGSIGMGWPGGLATPKSLGVIQSPSLAKMGSSSHQQPHNFSFFFLIVFSMDSNFENTSLPNVAQQEHFPLDGIFMYRSGYIYKLVPSSA